MRLPWPLLLLAGCATLSDPGSAGPGRLPLTVASAGTGFRFGAEHLLTAAHVVAGCPALWVADADGKLTPAQIVTAEKEVDVAVLRAGAQPWASARLATQAPVAGTELVAIGYPGPALHGPPERVRFRAILLPLPRPDERMALRGSNQPGMSGSPLVDAAGEVVGMLLAKGDATAPEAAALVERLGFPVDSVAVMVPAPWLRAMASVAGVPEHPATLSAAAPVPSRILCLPAGPGGDTASFAPKPDEFHVR